MLDTQINQALAVVQDIFRQVRPLILGRAGHSKYKSKDRDGSPVTETDIEVERTIQAAMAKHFPDVRVYGEETGYDENVTGTFWLVDPIDGTKSFIEGVPNFTSMAVLIQNDEAVASVIYNPSAQDMYVAQKGKGAYKNGVRLNLADVPLAKTAICKGRFIDELTRMLAPKGITCDTKPEPGGYGFAMVAEGSAAARFNMLSRGYIHDYAPGALLVREAGGVILPIQEESYTYKTRSFVVCHPELQALLRPRLADLRALEAALADK